MKTKKCPPDDTFQIRCPKLGHQIHFSYCCKENFSLPCSRTLICWHSYFQAEEYLRDKLSPKEWQEAFEKPVKPKIQSLVELIDQAREKKKEKDSF